jgi:protein-S-isoprenylcysteine O-methyltransferase Ste14
VETPKPKKAAKKPKVEATPTRQSKRIAEKLVAEAFSDDETEKVTLAPNPDLPDARGKKKGWSFEWFWAIVFMLLGPAILVSLHSLCTKTACQLAVPNISTDVKAYIDKESIILVLAYGAVVQLVPRLLPLGKKAKGLNGGEVRMNGFLTLLACLAVVPGLVYYKIPLNVVYDKYNYIMATCIILPFICALTALVQARWGKRSNINSKGNTGNLIVDYFNGRELNPRVLGFDLKLICFRFSMIALALINVIMVADNIVKNNGSANPTVVLASAFQVLYALDAMFFEEYYFNSHDAMNSGYGWSLMSSYFTFPFLPTLITKYLIDRSPVVAWYYLALIGLMNAVGYVIFRSSETQRCEFAKNPGNPALAHLETVNTAGGRKLIVSGWWGLVRHPNYLGEILIQWSWVLPTGLTDLLPYYLPFVTTLMIVIRCHQINQRNKRKYGTAWDSYCEKVRSNILPKVY